MKAILLCHYTKFLNLIAKLTHLLLPAMTSEGRVSPGFERVQQVFSSLFEHCDDLGASCTVFVNGELVVDLWGGSASKASATRGKPARPWAADTLVNVYSCTKAMANLCVMHLVDRGLCRYDEAITRYWPEFGANGKESVTVQELLSHQAGLCYLEGEQLSQDLLMDWTRALQSGIDHELSQRLAEQAPVWPLKLGLFGYHPLSIGFFVSELVRRVDPKRRGYVPAMRG